MCKCKKYIYLNIINFLINTIFSTKEDKQSGLRKLELTLLFINTSTYNKFKYGYV